MALARSRFALFGVALGLVSGTASADRIALLPPLADAPPEELAALQAEVSAGLIRAGHQLVPQAEVDAAVAGLDDGKADSSPEYATVGKQTGADWVVAASVEPAVTTKRVELTASMVESGRTESVAREVDKPQAADQIAEMVPVLVRPEGVGMGALPWEIAAAPPQVATDPPEPSAVVVTAPPPAVPPPPEPTGPRKIHMDYMSESHDVWPPYSAGHPWYLAASQGLTFVASAPDGADGTPVAIVGMVRGGGAITDLGFELLGELGGNLAGPAALWLNGRVRWMMTPSAMDDDDYGLGFHVGPAVFGGAFFRLPGPDVESANGEVFEASGEVAPMLGAAIDMSMSITPQFLVEANLGNLTWVPLEDGSVVLVGGTIGVGLRL